MSWLCNSILFTQLGMKLNPESAHFTAQLLCHFRKTHLMWSAQERKHAGVPFWEMPPLLDNAALFQVKEHGVVVLIMTQGGAFLLTKLFYPNVCLT